MPDFVRRCLLGFEPAIKRFGSELYAIAEVPSDLERTGQVVQAFFDLIILDELGFLPMDATASNHLFQVVAQAYERRSLIITSNRPFQEWGTVFANATIATAVLDRLLHHAHILNLQGGSYRLKGAMAATS